MDIGLDGYIGFALTTVEFGKNNSTFLVCLS